MKQNTHSEIIIKIADIACFLILLFVFGFFFSRLVYCQSLYAETGNTEGYYSDILAYMQHIQGPQAEITFEKEVYSTLDTYPLFFLLGKLLYKFMDINHAIMWSELILNSLAIILSKYFFEKSLPVKEGEKDHILRHILISLGVCACFIMSMWWLPRFGKITLPFKDQVFYGTYSGNPWHNATYIAVRPFAISTFFAFVYLMKKIPYKKDGKAENGEKLKVWDFVLFSVSLFLSVLTKPTFALVFYSASVLVFLFRLFASKGKQIKVLLLVALSYIPAALVLLYQFGGVFGKRVETSEEHGIGFTFFGVWRSANPHVAAAIFYANVFALVTLCFFIKELKNDFLYRFGVLYFAVALLEAGLLCEKGFRYSHFNFSWGYMHGIFFFSMVSIVILLKECLKKKKRWPVIVISSLSLLSQVVFGILYFKGLYYGLDYNTLLPSHWL